MASLSKHKNGTRRILFADGQGKRHTIYLGKLPKRESDSIRRFVERILSAQISGQPMDNETARWLSDRPEWLFNKLAGVGLAKRREAATIQKFIRNYIESRIDVKPRTILKYEIVAKKLVEFFGPECLIRDITAGDVDAFRLSLVSLIGESTIGKTMQIAKQFFKSAMRNKLITENPFEDQKTTVGGNPDRFYFVTREETEKVLKACPNAEWRLIVALARFGGLRCPSEHLALRWHDVDWEKGRIHVQSPKTEHHEGKAVRTIPMFPELEAALNDVWERPETEGKTFIINRYRCSNSNLRTQFNRIVRSAGIEPWQKPFQNMRSTRETELANEFPIQVVCQWIGNSPKVAMRHYLQTTDDHFDKAVGRSLDATRNATQSMSDKGVIHATSKTENPVKHGQSVTVDDAKGHKNRPGRTRTRDKGIMSPLL